jgi:hypothetical protein
MNKRQFGVVNKSVAASTTKSKYTKAGSSKLALKINSTA